MEKKEFKISLKLLVILVIVLAIVIGGMFVVVNEAINKKAEVKESKAGNEEPEVPEVPEEPEVPSEDILNSDFDLKFLKLENNSKNMIYSPLSIKYALSMLNEGADEETKAQIEEALGDIELTKYENIEDKLALANSIFIRDTFFEYVKEEYMDTLVEKYNAEIKEDLFKDAKNMNEWIEEKTLGIIKDMLEDDIVQNPETVMVLINALAIDMEWVHQFSPEDTHSGDFYCEDGSTIDATTMFMKDASDNTAYYIDDEVTALTMDLEKCGDTQLEFVAIMPEEDLSKYVEDFEIEDLKDITKNMEKASKTKAGLNISIPRFKFNYKLELKEDLRKLGITDAFDADLANFSKISEEPLFVSDALHLADIDFTEKGVKAAAVTVIYLTCGVALEENKPIDVTIDKPFMYVIRDKATEEIWFVGTVYEPNLWEDDQKDYEYR